MPEAQVLEIRLAEAPAAFGDIEDDHFLGAELVEAHGQGRARIAHVLEGACALRGVQVAEGDVVEGRGNLVHGNGAEGAPVEPGLAGKAPGVHGVEVAHGQQGQVQAAGLEMLARKPGLREKAAGHAPAQLLVAQPRIVGQALHAHVGVAQIGHGAEQGAGLALAVLQPDKPVFRQGGLFARHPDAVGALVLGRGVEHRGRVVVAADDHGLAAARALKGGQKLEEAPPGQRRGGHGVEDVACHQQGVGLDLVGKAGQPVQKGLVLVVAGVVAEQLAKMPVRGVQQAHGADP